MAIGTHTALFGRTQPNSLFAIESADITTGARFYVGSTVTGATNAADAGRNPDTPFATIDYAIAYCEASAGDIIYVLPGHAENITTATGINVDVAGISIIGLGEGNLIPTITSTAAEGSVTVAAANVLFRNLRFVAGFATGVTTAFTIADTALGLTMDRLQFRDTTTNLEFLIHATVAASITDLLVTNCSFHGLAGDMSESFLFAGASTNCEMAYNVWDVDSSDSTINHSALAAINMYFHHNTVVNKDTGAAGYCVEFKTGSTGALHDNRLGYNKNNAEVFLGDAMFWFENYMSNTIGEAGRVMPVATHTIP